MQRISVLFKRASGVLMFGATFEMNFFSYFRRAGGKRQFNEFLLLQFDRKLK